MRSFTGIALDNFPLIDPGDDIAKKIVDVAEANGLKLENGDLVVIAQKILSKAEKRIVRLGEMTPSGKAKKIAMTIGKGARFIEMVLRETKRILKTSSDVLLVEDNRGLICINAGIDKSNVKGSDNYALLPENPDRSAERTRAEIRKLTGRNVAVIVCDTYSRPFRRGQVNFAIGISGIDPFKDYRGKKDLFGQTLKVKCVAVVDEIAAAAELLMGQAREKTPVVIFRGLANFVKPCDDCTISQLFISRDEDLFKNTL